MYEIKRIKDHFEVFLNGIFQFSADSEKEAELEIAALCAELGV